METREAKSQAATNKVYTHVMSQLRNRVYVVVSFAVH